MYKMLQYSTLEWRMKRQGWLFSAAGSPVCPSTIALEACAWAGPHTNQARPSRSREGGVGEAARAALQHPPCRQWHGRNGARWARRRGRRAGGRRGEPPSTSPFTVTVSEATVEDVEGTTGRMPASRPRSLCSPKKPKDSCTRTERSRESRVRGGSWPAFHTHARARAHTHTHTQSHTHTITHTHNLPASPSPTGGIGPRGD